MSDTKLDPRSLTSEEQALPTMQEIHDATTLVLANPLLHKVFNWLTGVTACRALFGEPASEGMHGRCDSTFLPAFSGFQEHHHCRLMAGHLGMHEAPSALGGNPVQWINLTPASEPAKVECENCRQTVDYADQHYHREDMPHVAAYFVCDKPAKVECPNCGKVVHRSTDHCSMDQGPHGPLSYDCKPAQPEPVATVCPNCGEDTYPNRHDFPDGRYVCQRRVVAKVFAQEVCPNCAEQTPYSHKSHHDDHYTCEPCEPFKPAQPEPVATVCPNCGHGDDWSHGIGYNKACMAREQPVQPGPVAIGGAAFHPVTNAPLTQPEPVAEEMLPSGRVEE